MRLSKFTTLAAAGVLWLGAYQVAPQGSAYAADTPGADKPDNAICLACHGMEGFQAENAAGQMRSLHVVKDKFEKSVHGKRLCVECHKNITEIPHQKGLEVRVSCVQCHQDLWEKAKIEGKTQENALLGVVVAQID